MTALYNSVAIRNIGRYNIGGSVIERVSMNIWGKMKNKTV